jgi:hypothetical protein
MLTAHFRTTRHTSFVGGRFELKELERVRQSFAIAVQEAQRQWEQKSQPAEFAEFVRLRELSGEDLKLTKGGWTKDKESPTCQLCTAPFGLKTRKHHCRSCGALVCDAYVTLHWQKYAPLTYACRCSTKRLQLSMSSASSVTSASTSGKSSELERVCDGCFNRLVHEVIPEIIERDGEGHYNFCFVQSMQPSPDHFRVKQLRQSAIELINR